MFKNLVKANLISSRTLLKLEFEINKHVIIIVGVGYQQTRVIKRMFDK